MFLTCYLSAQNPKFKVYQTKFNISKTVLFFLYYWGSIGPHYLSFLNKVFKTLSNGGSQGFITEGVDIIETSFTPNVL